MAKRPLRLRLLDILAVIEEAGEILDGAELSEYEADVVKRRGIERCIEIISEACRFIPPETTASHPEIPWDEIKGIGNHLRHGYHRVSDYIIWRAAAKSLAELKPVIEQMLHELDPPTST